MGGLPQDPVTFENEDLGMVATDEFDIELAPDLAARSCEGFV